MADVRMGEAIDCVNDLQVYRFASPLEMKVFEKRILIYDAEQR